MLVAINCSTDEMRTYTEPVRYINYGFFTTKVVFENGTEIEFPAYCWSVINH